MSILPPITPETQWRPVRGYEEYYAVSSAGHVISVRGWNTEYRRDGRTNKNLGKLISAHTDKYGYVQYGLGDSNGYRHTHQAHRLVYEAFIGDVPDGWDVDHIDNSKDNNNVENLQSLTHQENIEKSWRKPSRHERVRRGQEHPDAKIIEDDIIDICLLASQGMSQRQIAEMYNLSHVAVGYILRGETWKHVDRQGLRGDKFRQHNHGKLSVKDVYKIRQLAVNGVSTQMIADGFNITESYATGIINRYFFSELPDQLPLFQEAK